MRNYGIYLRYLTRTIIVNMYKEYRSNTICGAVSQLYIDLAGKHSGRAETVQIIRTKVINKIAVPGEESDKPTLKRANAIAFTKKGE